MRFFTSAAESGTAKQSAGQRGQAMVESCICMIFLLLFMLAILDIFNMSVTRIATDYASYIAARGRALGYNDTVIEHKTQLAAASASGQDLSQPPAPPLANWYDVNERAYDYSRWGYGGYYHVRFKYWYQYNDPNGTANDSKAYLSISTGEVDNGVNGYVTSRVGFYNYPLNLINKYFVSGGTDTYDPKLGTVELKNHSQAYLQ